MVVRTNPVGARLQVDGQDIEGRTPLEVPFDWAGVRQVTAMAPGYKVLEAQAKLTDPWYAAFPFDVFTDLLWPGTIEDHQEFEFHLEPYQGRDQPLTAAQEAEIDERLHGLMVRAEAHRKGGLQGPDRDVLARGASLPGAARPASMRPGGGLPGSTVPPVRMEGDERPPAPFGTDVDEPPPPPPAPIRDDR